MTVAILIALLVRLPTLAQPLLEKHAFRQTQTAYTALIFHEHGIDLLQPQVPVLGPPFEIPFEFPLFQALATLPMALGAPPDAALRGTSLLFFLVSALLLWRLVRRLAGSVAALAAVVVYLYSPFAMVWSRTAMIEYLVVAAALGYLAVGIAWLDERQAWQWLIAILMGCVAMTVKATSGFFWAIPLLAYRPRPGRSAIRDPWLLALVAVPAFAGFAWTRYADDVRSAGQGTAWMTASSLAPWLFGPLGQRIDPGVWAEVVVTLAGFVVGPALLGLLPAAGRAARSARPHRFWVALLAAPALSILIFLNLYRQHDYYAAAVSPVVAAAFGLTAACVWRRGDLRLLMLMTVVGVTLSGLVLASWIPPAIALLPAPFAAVAAGLLWRARWVISPAPAAVGAGVIVVVMNLVSTVGYWGVAYETTSDPEGVLPRAVELARLSRPDDEILVVGDDWSPALLYYARRRGQMLPAPLLRTEFVAALPTERYGIMSSRSPDSDPLWPTGRWPWVGALGPGTYALADSPTGLRGATLIAGDDAEIFATASRAGRALLPAPLVLTCGIDTVIPAGRSGTWLHLAPVSGDTRIRASADLAPISARPFVALAPTLASAASLRLACGGASSVVILEAVDAPVPK